MRPSNILPTHPEENESLAYYYDYFLSEAEAKVLFQEFLDNTPWKNEEILMFGKKLVLNRKVAFYGDKAYGYSGIVKNPYPWTDTLLNLKGKLEKELNTDFNVCLLNFYPSGIDSMGFHSDDEKELGQNPLIASISLGATRTFSFQNKKSNEKVNIDLITGSLLVMSGACQHNWKHSLPKSNTTESRINLTFRKIVF